jgi:hypothetical protein
MIPYKTKYFGPLRKQWMSESFRQTPSGKTSITSHHGSIDNFHYLARTVGTRNTHPKAQERCQHENDNC